MTRFGRKSQRSAVIREWLVSLLPAPPAESRFGALRSRVAAKYSASLIGQFSFRVLYYPLIFAFVRGLALVE
jgi:hypothetical protein